MVSPAMLTIGAVSQRSGTAPSALRFYESKGLIHATWGRSERGVRLGGCARPAGLLFGEPEELSAKIHVGRLPPP